MTEDIQARLKRLATPRSKPPAKPEVKPDVAPKLPEPRRKKGYLERLLDQVDRDNAKRTAKWRT